MNKKKIIEWNSKNVFIIQYTTIQDKTIKFKNGKKFIEWTSKNVWMMQL